MGARQGRRVTGVSEEMRGGGVRGRFEEPRLGKATCGFSPLAKEPLSFSVKP